MHHGRFVVHHALLIMHSGGAWANMSLSFLIFYYALCIMSISTVQWLKKVSQCLSIFMYLHYGESECGNMIVH